MASLLSWSLLSLIYNIPLSQAIPVKRQFRSGGYGQPGYQVGPPWLGAPRFGPPDTAGPPDGSPALPETNISPEAFSVPPAQQSDIPTNNISASLFTGPGPSATAAQSLPPQQATLPTPAVFSSITVLTSDQLLTPGAAPAPAETPAQFFPSAQGTAAAGSFRNTTISVAQPNPASNTQVPVVTPTIINSPKTNLSATTPPAVVPPNPVATPSAAPSAPSIGDNPTLLNGTLPGNTPPANPPQSTTGIDVEVTNSFNEAAINVYVTAKDEAGRVMLLLPDQTWFYPTANSDSIPTAITENIVIPVGAMGASTTMHLPGFFQSGRIYFSTQPLQFSTLLNPSGGVTLVAPDPFNPSDPAATSSWSFVEMTYSSVAGLFANLSFVDFLGLPVGMSLSRSSAGGTFAEGASADANALQMVQGTGPSSLEAACAALNAKAVEEGEAAWGSLCEYASGSGSDSGMSSSSSSSSTQQQILRVDAPGKYIAARDSRAFETYWDSYVQQVWAKYASEPLYVDTQNDLGVVECSTASGFLTCAGASRPLPAPLSTITPLSALSIFSCSGIFSTQATDNAVDLAVLPRICAALNRSTLLLAGGNTQPSLSEESYYGTGPTNWYAKVVHQVESDGRGYAFAYDDVNPTGARDQSGTLTAGVGSVGVWRIEVGGLGS